MIFTMQSTRIPRKNISMFWTRMRSYLNPSSVPQRIQLLMLEPEFFTFSRKVQNLRYINPVSFHGVVHEQPIDIFVIPEEIESPFLRIFQEITQKKWAHKVLPFGEASYIPLSNRTNPFYLTSQPEYFKLFWLLALGKELRIEENKMAALKDIVQGMLVRSAFFKGYKKTRYVAHDRIHHWVSRGLNLPFPTVDAVLSEYTQVYPKDFHQLQSHQKCSILVEEALVLGMERFLIKQIAESTHTINTVWEHYFNGKQDNPSVLKLEELCTPGEIGDHPDWMASWGMQHKKTLQQHLNRSLKILRDNYPSSLNQYLVVLDEAKKKQPRPIHFFSAKQTETIATVNISHTEKLGFFAIKNQDMNSGTTVLLSNQFPQ